MSRPPVNRIGRGFVIGSLVGIAIFVLAMVISGEAPELAGMLLVPFVIAFFGTGGALIGGVVPSERDIVRLKAKYAPVNTFKDCCYAIGVCLLIAVLLFGIIRIIACFS